MPRSVQNEFDYITAARSVVQAGHAFSVGIEGNRAQARAVTTRLEKRLAGLGGRAAAADLGFSGEGARDPGAQREPPPDDLLARALVDLQAGRMAVAAGRLSGELGEPDGRDEYEDSLVALDQTTRSLERAPESFGFGASRGKHPARSADAQSARLTFEKEAAAALDTVVDQTSRIATLIVDKAKTLPGAATLTDLVAKAREWQDVLPAIGKLVRLGIMHLRRALQALLRLLRLNRVEQVQDQLAAWWDRLTAPGLGTGMIREATGVSAAQRSVEAALAGEPTDVGALDDGSGALRELAGSFNSRIEMVDRVLRALALAAGVLTFVVAAVAAVNPYVIALSAAAYLLILSWVLLTARDHTDSGLGIERMRGVTAIADGLAHS